MRFPIGARGWQLGHCRQRHTRGACLSRYVCLAKLATTASANALSIGIPGYLVAIKQLKSIEASALEELTREAAFMAQLNHDNIVKLNGVVTVCLDSQSPLYLC